VGGSVIEVVALGGFRVAVGEVVRPVLAEGTAGATWLGVGPVSPGRLVAGACVGSGDGGGGGVVATVDSSGAAGWTGVGSEPR